ncbi:MAG: hypothetical protein ACK5PZ_19830 [Pirellula sp.]|jgi:hypothetical protein
MSQRTKRWTRSARSGVWTCVESPARTRSSQPFADEANLSQVKTALQTIEELPAFDRDRVRWMLAGLASIDRPFGWYGFASVGLLWIERLLRENELVRKIRVGQENAYLISPAGREVHARLKAKYGVLDSYPKSLDEHAGSVDGPKESANNPMDRRGGSAAS